MTTLRCWLAGWTVVVLTTLIPQAALASNTNSNYNVYNYDMTTPTFTPDGRLLQVEYASSAAESSSPLVALQLFNDTLVLMTLRSSNTQNRMVLLEGEEDNSNPICVAMSGVLADSVALLQQALTEAAKHLRMYKKPLSILQVATAMANACQSHSFGGGIRPYGSTMLVCGFMGSDKTATIYQTDPSGAIVQAPLSPSSSSLSSPIRWVVGGTTALQRQLRKRIDSALARQPKKSHAMADTIALVARTLIKESQKSDKGNKDSSAKKKPPSLEVVIMSSQLGCHRLTKDQLDAIVERI